MRSFLRNELKRLLKNKKGCVNATEHAKRRSTNLSAFNGEIHVGDYVLYEDGWLTFTAQIVEQDGVCGFFLEDDFQPLLEFVRDMSLNKEECDAAIDFTILNPKGDPQ